MKTTIGKIKSFNPCKNGWKKLISFHGEDFEKELSPMEILKSNGIKDAVWSLKAFDDQNKVRLFAADIAESVLYIFENQYPNDDRPRKAIEAARKFANGEISKNEMRIARDAAYDVYDACAAVCAARAARAACAIYDAAYDTADAALDAARAVADIIADTVRGVYEKKWQEIENLFVKYFEVIKK